MQVSQQIPQLPQQTLGWNPLVDSLSVGGGPIDQRAGSSHLRPRLGPRRDLPPHLVAPPAVAGYGPLPPGQEALQNAAEGLGPVEKYVIDLTRTWVKTPEMAD